MKMRYRRSAKARAAVKRNAQMGDIRRFIRGVRVAISQIVKAFRIVVAILRNENTEDVRRAKKAIRAPQGA